MSVRFRSMHAVVIAVLSASLAWTHPALPAGTDHGARILIAHPQQQDELYGSTILFAKPISYGCINVPAAFYETHISPIFAIHRALVYVLPEFKPMQEIFPAYDVAAGRR